MTPYSTLNEEEKNKLVEEFVMNTDGLPDPENYPKVVKTMFRFFLYDKDIEV